MAASVLRRLDFIHLVVVNHHEPDHMDAATDAATLRALARVNPGLVLICPAAIARPGP
jgi:hypothetical protein